MSRPLTWTSRPRSRSWTSFWPSTASSARPWCWSPTTWRWPSRPSRSSISPAARSRMNAKRPDLAKLTPVEKDALIRDLRRQVAAGQSELRLLNRRRAAEEASGRAGVARASCARPRRGGRCSRRAGFAVKLGRRLAALAVAGGDGHGGDPVAGICHRWRRRHLAAARPASAAPGAPAARARRALNSLYVELKSIVLEADGKSYRMTVSLQNIDPAVPLYVMLNPVGVYVQSGMTWQQVPSSPVERRELGRRQAGRRLFLRRAVHARGGELGRADPRLHACAHPVRHADQPQAQPGNDIVERRTPFYVYLKPHGANDADIKASGRCRHAAGLHPDAAALIFHIV